MQQFWHTIAMTETKATARPASRLRKYSMLLAQALLFVFAFMAISAYQARTLLATDGQPAPDLDGISLQGELFRLADVAGRPVLIYFFAPWCPYCSASADNVVRLRRLRSEEQLAMIAVALDWQDEQEVRNYVDKHELNTTVVLGTAEIARKWQVHGFPTYYVLDSKHRVVRRDFGYSTQIGLLWRSWSVD